MSEIKISYDKKELRSLLFAFKAMDAQATEEAKKQSFELASFAAEEIKKTARTREKAAQAVQRVADGVAISKSSKIGEFSYGFARQKFSGGGSTQILWPGLEFGSSKFKQFPKWSGRQGTGSRGGSKGWFIYPTLRRIQPELIKRWEDSFDRILKEWS